MGKKKKHIIKKEEIKLSISDFYDACRHGDLKVVKNIRFFRLWENPISIMEALQHSQTEVIMFLLPRCTNVTWRNNHLLWNLFYREQREAVKFLFNKPEVRRNLLYHQKFQFCCYLNDTVLFDELIQIYDPREEDSDVSVYESARWGSIEIVERLLPLFGEGKYIWYLEGLCHNNDIKNIKRILPMCDLNVPNHAIQICCEYQYVELTEILLKHGCDPIFPNNNPLIEACGHQNLPLCILLTKYGARPDVDTTQNEEIKTWFLKFVDKNSYYIPFLRSRPNTLATKIIKKWKLIILTLYQLLPRDILMVLIPFLLNPFTEKEIKKLILYIEHIKKG